MGFKKKLNIGGKYGMLTVIEEVEPSIVPHVGMEDREWVRSIRMVRCLCECGNEVIRKYPTLPKMLKKGRVSSCGCYNPNKSKDLAYDAQVDGMNNKEKKDYVIKLINEGFNNVEINLITKRSVGNISLIRKSIGKGNWVIKNGVDVGMRNNRLVILAMSDKSTSKSKHVICQCDCGNIVDVAYRHFISGSTKSCGCFKKELAKEMMNKLLPNHIKHLDSNRKSGNYYLYQTWMGLKQRCFNSNNKRYYAYGARGINVYEPWVNDYVMFKEWILNNLGHRPITISNKRSENYSLDRINNDGNYEPGNLKWSTFKEQRNNKRARVKNTSENVMYRITYEKYFNIKIEEGYQIHHIDGNRKNNDPLNLIDVTPKEHGWLHRKTNKHLRNKTRDEIKLILKQNYKLIHNE